MQEMKVGPRIKRYLEENNIPQNWLSLETGFAAPKLNLMLTGKRRMQVEEYIVICKALKVPLDTFLTPRLPEKQVS